MPWVTVAVIVQLVSQVAGALRVMTGGLSLQLWTSSVGALTFEVVELLLLAMLALPPLKMSMFQKAALPLVTTCLAKAGVQLVAILPETLSVVAEVLFLAVPPTYHDGYRSLAGLGSISP